MVRLASPLSMPQAYSTGRHNSAPNDFAPSDKRPTLGSVAPRAQLPAELWKIVAKHANDKAFVALLGTSHGLRQLPSPQDMTLRLQRNFAPGHAPKIEEGKEKAVGCLVDVLHRADALRKRLREGNDSIAKPLRITSFALHPSGDSVALGDAWGQATSHPLLPTQSFGSSLANRLPSRLHSESLGYDPQVLTAHFDPIRFLQYSKDGRFLVTSLTTGLVQIQDLSSHNFQTISLPNLSPIVPTEVSSDAKYALAVSDSATLHHWDLNQSPAIERTLANPHAQFKPYQVRFAPNGRFVAADGTAGGVGWRLHDSKGKLFLWDAAKEAALPTQVNAGEEWLCHFDFSPKATFLATVSDNGQIRLWDPQQENKELRSWFGDLEPVSHLAFSSDEQLLAVASTDQKMKVWDLQVEPPKLSFVFETPRQWLISIKFSPDSRYLLAETKPWYDLEAKSPISLNHSIRGWDLTRRNPEMFENQLSSPWGNTWQFSPDSRFVMAKDGDTLRVWELPGADD